MISKNINKLQNIKDEIDLHDWNRSIGDIEFLAGKIQTLIDLMIKQSKENN